jgi:16S rRNA processing protein RimM
MDPILLGVVGRPHGVRGHVHVHSYTAAPEDLAAYGVLADGRGRRFSLRWVAGGVAELSELGAGDVARRIADRGEAERLTNTQLFVDRADLPPPAEDEFYLADLIGLAAVAADGAALGQVTALHDYGAGASLEIAGAAPVLVPFTRACVPEVDLSARRVVVRLPEELVVEGMEA